MLLNIELIRKSFNAIKPYADEVMDHFQDQLFNLNPQFKTVFKKSDLLNQKKSFVKSMDYVLNNWEQKELIESYIQTNGRKFGKVFKLQPEHYEWIGKSFLQTFEYYLESHWSEELKAEWTHFYLYISELSQKDSGLQIVESPVQVLPVSLGSYARECAKKLLKNAMEFESNQQYKEVAREKARSVLLEALEIETSMAFKDEDAEIIAEKAA